MPDRAIGDRLLVSELSRLGRSLSQVIQIVTRAIRDWLAPYADRGDWG